MKREIMKAETRGFCSGVKHALSLVENALREGPFPVRVLHEIVHNEHVVDSFRERGVVFAEEIDPAWTGGTLILSAHGVSGKIEEQAKRLPVKLVDATCPIVLKLHEKAQKLEAAGKRIILIGKRTHRETEGTIGRLKDLPVILENARQAETIAPEPGVSYACITQTTLSTKDCAEIFSVLRKRIPGIEICPGVCAATEARQEAVRELAEKCSAVIVIGSEKSSNSKRLCEEAEKAGVRACLIPDKEALDPAFLRKTDRRIGITSGASAPEYLVEELISYLEKSEEENK